MKKRKMFVLAALAALTAGMVACGMSTTGGDPDSLSQKCQDTRRIHPESMGLSLKLNCEYQKTCNAEVTFIGAIKDSLNKNTCFLDFDFLFDDGFKKEHVRSNSTIPLTVYDDDHVRFSLFDETNAEKSYDIDLSEIIHSYTIKGDSVEIKMPENLLMSYIKCPYCQSMNNSAKICEGHYMCHYSYVAENPFAVVGLDSTWGKYIIMDLGLNSQSSMNGDSISVSARIYFRE